MKQYAAAILDLDQTLVDSTKASAARARRSWSTVYAMIPSFSLYTGIEALLETLEAKGVRIAIVTNTPTPYANRVLSHFGIRPNALIAWHDTAEHKPAAAPYLEAIRRLGTPPVQTIAVGDSPDDIAAACRAGIDSIGAMWGSSFPREMLSQATHLCARPEDVLAVIRA